MTQTNRRRNINRRNATIKKLFRLFLLTGLFLCLLLLLLGILAVCLYGDDIYDMYQNSVEKSKTITESSFKNKTETVIYDRQGNVLAKVAPNDYSYIDAENIQPDIKNAVIAIEDHDFYRHKGYDLKAIARAGYALIKHKGEITQGGSTITQQLVKLQFLSLKKSFERKLNEVFLAIQLEKKFSKEEILEFYLNNINYGNGAYGIETASKTYFNKPSSELTLSEVAFLTAIPNNPTYYNPVRNIKHTLKRRNLILSKMKEYGYIHKNEYQNAIQKEIVLDMPVKEVTPESYEVSFALSSATKILMDKQNFPFQYWFNSEGEQEAYLKKYNDRFLEINAQIRNGGYSIYTTIDKEKQKELQESVNQELSGYTKKDPKTGIYELQGAAVTIDNLSGDVLAIVGGRTQKDVDNTFNRAFLSARQPGSAIKPLVVYTPAFERGTLASTIMMDNPIEGGPQNAGKTYKGSMTIREAVERSINTIPYELVKQYGPREMLSYLEKMEFSHLSPHDNHAGIALGGFTNGTNPYEMASAYSTLARNGEYIKATGLSKIEDLTKNVLYLNHYESKTVYDVGSAFLMTDVLKGVLTEPYATGRGYNIPNMTSAGKTGTTNDNKDVWFAGFTPYYTTVTWVGYDLPQKVESQKNLSAQISKDYMTAIHQGLPNKEFEQPEWISYMYVNPKTGEASRSAKSGWQKELVPSIYFETK